MNVASVTASAMIHGLTAGRQASRLIHGCGGRAHYANPDLGRHRHAGTQLVIVVRARIEHDLDRNALHDFHVVSGGIFRRQQAEAGAAGAGDAVHLAVVGSAVGVDVDGDALADLHFAQLRFFEVGGDPNVVEIDDLHQFLAGSDVLPDFDGAIADDAVHRGNDLGVLQVQCGLIEIRFLALRLRQGRCGPGARDLHLLGRGVGVAPVGLAPERVCPAPA